MSLLPVAEAQARLLALAPMLPVETVPIAEAAGRFLAASIVAKRDQPAANLSAMDGYAIRAADLPGPWTVIGESAAGHGLDRAIGVREAARIFTGAPLPTGADTILIQEDATRDGDALRLTGDAPAFSQWVRQRASDFGSGQTLIEAGARLTPPRIALAIAGGHGAVRTARRPRVAILSTGDELVPPGAPATGVMLPASNGVMLAAMLAQSGAIVTDHGIVPDRLDALAAAFAQAAASADIVVSIGGVSVGDHDLVRPALDRLGATLDFWKVAMRPGKPLMAGRLGEAIMLGLPGNPVSAFVTARLFLLPLVAHLSGDPDPLPAPARATLAAPLPATGERADFLRARRDGAHVHPLPSRDSALLAELVKADVLIVRPPHAPPAKTGDETKIIALA